MSGHSRKFDPSRMAYLESDERRTILDPDAVLRNFKVPTRGVIADIGCGPGVFTLPLAEIVGDNGRVYGVDTEPRMIERLRGKLRELGIQNIVVVQSTEDSIPLQDSHVDFALMVTVLHELEGLTTLHETRRILKEDGTLGVIDWKKKTEPMGPPIWHRLSEQEAAGLLAEAEFDPGTAFDLGRSHYGFAARRI